VGRANGLTCHAQAAKGPVGALSAGFHDHARSFRHQLPALAAAGFRVAPFMRG
jgi:hypothetical protein